MEEEDEDIDADEDAIDFGGWGMELVLDLARIVWFACPFSDATVFSIVAGPDTEGVMGEDVSISWRSGCRS